MATAEGNRNASDTEPAPTTVERAAEWYVLLQDTDVTERDRRAFARWHDAHPAHAKAYARLVELGSRFDRIPDESARFALRRAVEPDKKGAWSRAGKALALGLAVLGLAWLGLGTAPPSYWLADHRTAVGEIEQVALADNSRVTLNTYSAIDVRFGARRREIALHQGEILVTVAAADARPFVVKVPQGTITALGTEFVVRREDDHTHVAVLESRVRACARAETGERQCRVLEAGESGRLESGVATRTDTGISADVAAWADGRLVVDDRPLPEVLAELARYRRGPLIYDADELAGVQVSGVFPVDAPDRALAALAAGLPVRVRHYTPWIARIERQRGRVHAAK